MHNLSFLKTNSFLVKCILATFLIILLPENIFAQEYTPNEINYQGVARGANGKEICNKNISVTFSILENSVNGKLVYEERHSVTTNSYGLFSLAIGTGEITGGIVSNLGSIGWGNSAHFLRVKLLIDGGTEISGTTQMFAVPYALYAVKSGDAGLNFEKVAFDVPTAKITNNGAPVLDLSSLKQSLNFDQSTSHLSISGSEGVVDLSAFKHPPQDLRIDNDRLNVTGNTEATIVDLKPYKQTLSLTTEGKIAISNGNSVSIDTSSVNEIQDLSLVDNALKITKSITATSIDLSKYLDDTDKQILSRSGSGLSISNGNTLDISDMINLPWVGFSGNNLSGQALPGLAETLISWSEEFDSGNVLDNNRFTAPQKGIYNLSFSLIFISTSFTIRVYKNQDLIRSFDDFDNSFSHTMLLKLEQTDVITIKVYSSSGSSLPLVKGYFSGYRVN